MITCALSSTRTRTSSLPQTLRLERETHRMRVRNKKNLSEGKMMIRKLCILPGLASGIIMLLTACGTAAPASGVTTSNTVHMNDSNFVQSSVTIKKGESVTLVADTLT